MAWSSTLARSSSSSISPNQHLRYDSSSLCDTLTAKGPSLLMLKSKLLPVVGVPVPG